MGRGKIINIKRLKISKYDLDLCIFQKKWQSLIYGSAFLFSLVLGTWLQTIFMFISFNAVRPCFPKTFHHDIVSECIKWSIIMFCSSAFSLLAFQIYITVGGGLFVGLLCCYILHLVECWNLDRKQLKHFKNKITELENPNIYAMSEIQLREYCRSKKLNSVETDIVVYIILEQLKDVEIYTKMAYSKPHYYLLKRKIKTIIRL